MLNKNKAFLVCIVAFLMLSFATISPLVKAAGGITLTPNTNVVAGTTVQVQGTSFGATQAVGIGFGSEVQKNDQMMSYTGTGTGPYTGRVSAWPVKVGSFVLISDTSSGGGIVSTYTDKGDGTTTWSYDGSTMGTINYTTGVWSRSTTVDVSGYSTNYTATYTTYQYNLTTSTGATTSSTGDFTTSVTVPTGISNGVYNVVAVDGKGNMAIAQIGIGVAVPETPMIGAVVLLSIVAVATGAVLAGKPKIKILAPSK